MLNFASDVAIRGFARRQAVVHSALWFLWSWGLFVWGSASVLLKARISSSLNDIEAIQNFPVGAILLFLAAQLFVYIVLSAFIYLFAVPVLLMFKEKITRPLVVFHFLGLLVVYSLLLFHQYLYPYSAHPMGEVVPNDSFTSSGAFVYYIPVIFFLLISVFSMIYWGGIGWRKHRFLTVACGTVMIFFGVFGGFQQFSESDYVVQKTQEKPNIILIGVDSFSLDGISGEPGRSGGFLHAFVNESVLFENTKTTLARTYVAWMSLLTAKYPVNNGVRFNLYPRSEEQKSQILLENFKNAGYQIYYASDERRFSNLDIFHGFDEVVGPPIGAMDFLLGAMVDMPFTNLLLGSYLGEYFFPYSYANRAVAHAYEPNQYLDLLDKKLDSFEIDKSPVLFSAHLCLGHWPYFFRGAEMNANGKYQVYKDSMIAVDAMVEHLYNSLKKRGLLENAVVIFLSDHGEGFPEKYKNFSGIKPPSSYGHGTDLLDNDQNNILFSMQYFKSGVAQFRSKVVSYPASIIDIFPTLAGVVGVDISGHSVDGLNLHSLAIDGLLDSFPGRRARLLETEIHLKSMELSNSGKNVNVEGVLDEAAQYYRISEDGRMELNVEHEMALLKKKDRAVELDGIFLMWDERYGYRIFDEKSNKIRGLNSSDADMDMMSLFCEGFRVDVKSGVLDSSFCH